MIPRYTPAAFAALWSPDRRYRAWLDVEFYHGEEKEFDLAALDEALVSFALSVGPHGEVTTKLEPGRLITTCDGLTVSATNRPGPAK